jgi:hypothetical protein
LWNSVRTDYQSFLPVAGGNCRNFVWVLTLVPKYD